MLRSRQTGLTLTELMVAVVIAGLLMTVGVNSYSRWTQNQQVRVAAESILNGIQLARGEAVKRNTSVRFVLAGQSSWTVIEAAGGVAIQARSEQEGSRNATTTPTPGNAATITFNGMGRVIANADGSATLAQVDVGNPRGDRPLRITIGVGGSVRMCDPSPQLQAGDPRAC
jgi:type IV fimbrial biogenesis protein FimT